MPTVICLTPVRNEAINLPRFLACASVWADHIILADQHSTDGSRDVARQWPKVRLIDNPSPTFNEPERQRILVDAARQIPGPRVLIALDADECITADGLDSAEWREALAAPPGTVLGFQWVNLQPGLDRAWVPGYHQKFGFVDDDCPHEGVPIHSPRIPVPPEAPVLDLRHVKVLHYQYVDWRRMKRKQMWYQCWELLHTPGMRPLGIYRRYHKMDAIPPQRLTLVEPAWFEAYQRQGIDMRTQPEGPTEEWDRDIMAWMIEQGPRRFARLDLWDVDWNRRYREVHDRDPPVDLSDPRTPTEKRVHRWLARTQPPGRRLAARLSKPLLRAAGW